MTFGSRLGAGTAAADGRGGLSPANLRMGFPARMVSEIGRIRGRNCAALAPLGRVPWRKVS